MLCNAQPLVASTNKGTIAVAHNGNLVNGQQLREQLEAEGAIFNTMSDTEVLVHLIARSKTPDLEHALIDALSQVKGAYSMAVMSPNHLYAARDPHGFRPLVIGRLEDALVVSSGTCAFDLINPETLLGLHDFGVKVKLNPARELVAGQRVVLIDDSIVRGTTSRKIVRMLKAAGAKEVHMRISSPPTVASCFYGIDTPERHNLIANSRSLEEIRQFTDADSLCYLSDAALLGAVRNRH